MVPPPPAIARAARPRWRHQAASTRLHRRLRWPAKHARPRRSAPARRPHPHQTAPLNSGSTGCTATAQGSIVVNMTTAICHDGSLFRRLRGHDAACVQVHSAHALGKQAGANNPVKPTVPIRHLCRTPCQAAPRPAENAVPKGPRALPRRCCGELREVRRRRSPQPQQALVERPRRGVDELAPAVPSRCLQHRVHASANPDCTQCPAYDLATKSARMVSSTLLHAI